MRLSWEEIVSQYDREWVELVDYDWPEGEPYPSSGVLRSHGADKREFHHQCRREPVPSDSAILYVGHPVLPDGVVFSPLSVARVQHQ